jgi:integrase
MPGPKRPLSNMAADMLLRRMKAGDVTAHGLRSSFRDWAGELTTFPWEVAEAALAHAVGDETELAYKARRCAREAPQADGCLGELLRQWASSQRQATKTGPVTAEAPLASTWGCAEIG